MRFKVLWGLRRARFERCEVLGLEFFGCREDRDSEKKCLSTGYQSTEDIADTIRKILNYHKTVHLKSRLSKFITRESDTFGKMQLFLLQKK